MRLTFRVSAGSAVDRYEQCSCGISTPTASTEASMHPSGLLLHPLRLLGYETAGAWSCPPSCTFNPPNNHKHWLTEDSSCLPTNRKPPHFVILTASDRGIKGAVEQNQRSEYNGAQTECIFYTLSWISKPTFFQETP